MLSQTIAKKTKAEILDEYNSLLEKYDELKMISKTLNEPQNLELLDKAKEYTFDKIKGATDNLKNEIIKILSELSEKQTAEVQKLNDIQRAVEFSKKNLELNYGIQVAADTLQNLIQENENKKKEFEKELNLKKAEVEDEIWRTKRNWEREREEYDYDTEIKRRKDEDDYQVLKIQKEKGFLEREAKIVKSEEEIKNMRQQIDSFPSQMETALKQREREVAQKLNAEFENKTLFSKKDWVTEKNILEMQVKNLEELVKRQDDEIDKLRKEVENTRGHAQQLATKIIESGVSSKNPPKPEVENPSHN